MTTRGQRKLIVIHGWGGTFADAIERLLSLLSFRAGWRDGAVLVDRRESLLLRRLLQVQAPGTCMAAFQKRIISRMMSACFEPHHLDPAEATAFSDQRLARDFAHLGVPISPLARLTRATQLAAEADLVLTPLQPILEDILAAIRPADKEWAGEAEARTLIQQHPQVREQAPDLPEILETIRDMQETGGDLDTVASAVLYTHWLQALADKRGEAIRYGRDYEYVFVNYHERIRFLERYAPADVLMADLPIGALPGFADDVEYLATRGICIERFEDHHPYTSELQAMMERLVANGKLGLLSLSGPRQDAELAEAELQCGTDMVYHSTIAGQPWTTPGVAELRAAAHGEDFVTGRTPLGLMLTDLIKGGICKVELAQLLVAAIAGNDALERLRARGWADLTRELDAYYAECEHELHDHLVMLEFARPAGSLAGGAAAGLGSDVAVTSIRSPEATGPLDRNTMRILVSLAYRAEQGQPRLPAGKAVSYYAREFPEADYIFYCYGSSLLVARRLNQADLSLNLGAIMPELGGPGDGGHAGAAVCRPADNAFYPAAQLGQVAGGNFTRFAAYLAFRLQRLGYALTATRDLSRSTGDLSRGSIRLLLVTAAAVLAGALLVLCSARFERRAIVDSNADFFPQISSGAAVDDPFDAPEATPPVGAEEP